MERGTSQASALPIFTQVSLMQSLAGVFLMIGNLLLYPWLQRRQAPLVLQRLCMAMCTLGMWLLAVAAWCCATTPWVYTALLLVLFLRTTAPGMVFTVHFSFINNMVKDPSLRGGVTGLGQQV